MVPEVKNPSWCSTRPYSSHTAGSWEGARRRYGMIEIGEGQPTTGNRSCPRGFCTGQPFDSEHFYFYFDFDFDFDFDSGLWALDFGLWRVYGLMRAQVTRTHMIKVDSPIHGHD